MISNPTPNRPFPFLFLHGMTVYVPKGRSEKLKAAAAALGMSLNEYINAALDKFESSKEK